MVWFLFATKLERADTLEEANLNIGAPALYSATHRVDIVPAVSP
jgi:hypothetical protein